MTPYKQPNKTAAYLLFELAISLMVLMVLMQFLLPLLATARQQTSIKINMLDQLELKAAVMDHFQAQLSPIFRKACANGVNINIEIGPAEGVLPERINSKTLLAQSDWLLASQNGLCSTPLVMSSLTPSLALTCDWDAGDEVIFSSCDASAVGVVNEVSSSSTSLRFSGGELIGLSGVLLSQHPYIWYLAKGKSDNAFWRTPALSGNSLELWDGINYMSIYPLLDLDANGTLDNLTKEYGTYPLAQIKGLWFEMIVKQSACEMDISSSPQGVLTQYTNHRGLDWFYQQGCEFPLSFVVN